MVEFGEQLRKARENKGLTQQTLAEQLYVTRQTVSRWELGDRYPDLLTTKRLSQILEVSIDDLLSDNEMTKLVERTPVIEKKSANNLMIALYTLIAFIYSMELLQTLKPLFERENYVGPIYNAAAIVLIALYTGVVVAFIFGVINAIRGSLTPKKMGIINIMAYIGIFIIYGVVMIFASYMSPALKTLFSILTLGPAIYSFCVFKMFIRGNQNKIYPTIIYAGSIIEIIRTLFTNYNSFRHLGINDPATIVTMTIITLALNVLIAYQTYTLANKRQMAQSIANNA